MPNGNANAEGQAAAATNQNTNSGSPESTSGSMASQVVTPQTASQNATQGVSNDGLRLVQLDVFDLRVPIGTISRNVDFWKRLDESFLGFDRQITLDKNGVRMGLAPASEIAAIQSHLDTQQPRRSTIRAARVEEMDFEMRKNVQQQTLFVFDQVGDPVGRDFGPSDNLIYLSFRQALRNPQAVRVALAPAVRSDRTRLEYTGTGAEVRVRERTAETRFNYLDLNFEIPPDHFVVIAPSSKGTIDTSIGRAFFTDETPSERMERVLVLIPRVNLIAVGKEAR